VITVACVYKTGGDYDETYVERLAASVHRMLSLPHRFVCLTDVPKRHLNHYPIDQVIPLERGWPSWWAKMELFGLPGPVLYFDLDTVLTGSIDELATWIVQSKNSLLMLRGFYKSDKCSGILGWNGDLKWILDAFIEHYANQATWRKCPNATYMLVKRKQFRGDQEWLQSFLPNHPQLSVILAQDVMSGIYSYKVHVRNNGSIPQDAKIICFHGRPRPHEIKNIPWMEKNWNNLIEALGELEEQSE